VRAGRHRGELDAPRAAAHVRVGAVGFRSGIEQIADAVGHINSTVTKNTYRHQIADKVTAARLP
jgi:hypothetical protein